MANTSAVLPPPTHREHKPVTRCLKCGCYLRTGNLSTTCDPCGTPPWEEVDVDAVLSAAADTGSTRGRRKPIFDALLECMEGSA